MSSVRYGPWGALSVGDTLTSKRNGLKAHLAYVLAETKLGNSDRGRGRGGGYIGVSGDRRALLARVVQALGSHSGRMTFTLTPEGQDEAQEGRAGGIQGLAPSTGSAHPVSDPWELMGKLLPPSMGAFPAAVILEGLERRP